MQQAGAEYEQVVGGKGVDTGADPVPQDLSRSALAAEVEFGVFRVGLDPFDVSPGEIDLQVETGFGVSHCLRFLRGGCCKIIY